MSLFDPIKPYWWLIRTGLFVVAVAGAMAYGHGRGHVEGVKDGEAGESCSSRSRLRRPRERAAGHPHPRETRPMSDINKERRVIPSKVVPKTPPSSEAQRYYDSLPKSKVIRQPPGTPGGPYGGSKDPRKND